MVWQESAGQAWLGGLGKLRNGTARSVVAVRVRQGVTWRGLAGESRFGLKAWEGKARQACSGKSGWGMEWQARIGKVGRSSHGWAGRASIGLASRGSNGRARQAGQYVERCGSLGMEGRPVEDRLAGCGRSGPSGQGPCVGVWRGRPVKVGPVSTRQGLEGQSWRGVAGLGMVGPGRWGKVEGRGVVHLSHDGMG